MRFNMKIVYSAVLSLIFILTSTTLNSAIEGKFKLIVWNIENTQNQNIGTFKDKMYYAKTFSSTRMPNFYLLQEVAKSQYSALKSEFNFFSSINNHKKYNTVTITDSPVYKQSKTMLTSNCSGYNLPRGVIGINPYGGSGVTLINVHLSTASQSTRECVLFELTQLVNSYNNKVVVAGDFNLTDANEESKYSTLYRNFLGNTGLTDEGLNSGVDHIAYKGCRLDSVAIEPHRGLSDHNLIHAVLDCS